MPAQSTPQSSPPAIRNRKLLVNGTSLLAVFAFVSLLVFSPVTQAKFQSFDDTWRSWIGAAPGDWTYQWFWPMILQRLGDTSGASIAAGTLLIVCLIFRRWWHGLYAALAMSLIAGIGVQIFKHLFDRERPSEDAPLGLWASLFPVDSGSFPSGHSAAAAVLAVTLVVVTPIQWRLTRTILMYVGVVLVISMMVQRTLTNAHWLTDTIAGATFGAGCSLLLWYFMQPKLDAEQERPTRSTVH